MPSMKAGGRETQPTIQFLKFLRGLETKADFAPPGEVRIRSTLSSTRVEKWT